MNVTITLAEKARFIGSDGVVREMSVKRRYANLLYCLLAVHNNQSHDADTITFRRDDGLTLEVNLSVNHVSFGTEGEPEEKRLWEDDVGVGQIVHLLLAFIDRRDDELQKFQWSGQP